jgi:hypothetical protein
VTSCAERAAVDAHFEGRLARAATSRMFAHVAGCAACRTAYQRQLLLEQLDPRAPGPRRRLGRALGLDTRSRRWALIAPVALAAIAAVWLLVPRGIADYVARGNGSAGAVLRIYDVATESTIVHDRIRATSELAFAYANPEHRARLLIFGVDEHAHVYWYQPEWTDPATNPAAIPIERGGELRELPAATLHTFDAPRLTIYAVFTDELITVRAIEEWVAGGRIEPLAGAVVRELEVGGAP